MKILAAIDLSQVSAAIVQQAETLATATSGELWLLHVAAPDPDFVGYDPGPQSVRDTVAGELHHAHAQLQELAQSARADGLAVTALCVQGTASEVILSEAERLGVDMLVLGSHGHGRMHHLLTGSVTKAVLSKVTCPLLLVPARH